MPSQATAVSRRSVPPSYAFAGLDVLRLLACLSVLLYHFTFRGASRDALTSFSLPSLHGVSKYGFLGVHLFFIISGFVIAYSASGRSARQFFVSRFIRIYPTFVICMLLSFTIEWLLGWPVFKVTLAQLLANLIIVAPVLHQNFVDGAYWSIVCEVIFYGWIFLFKFSDVFDQHTVVIVASWIGLSVLNEFALHSSAVSWLLLTRYSGFFAIGVLLYQGRFHGWRLRTLLLLQLAIGLALVQVLRDLHEHVDDYQGTAFSDAVGVTACLAMIAAVGGIVLFGQCQHRRNIFLMIGGITYPLYLIHQNIGYIMLAKANTGMQPEALLLIVSAALILSAWVIFRFFERPMQRFLKARLARHGRIVAPSALAGPIRDPVNLMP